MSSLLVNEAGPGRVFVKLREATGIEHDETTGRTLHVANDWTPLYCVWCTSIYVSAVLMLVPLVALVPLAASAVCIIIQEKLVS